jgi:hypothetical protein
MLIQHSAFTSTLCTLLWGAEYKINVRRVRSQTFILQKDKQYNLQHDRRTL